MPEIHLCNAALHQSRSAPDPLFEATDDPVSFQDALIYHMRRFGDSYRQLYRAVVRLAESFNFVMSAPSRFSKTASINLSGRSHGPGNPAGS